MTFLPLIRTMSKTWLPFWLEFPRHMDLQMACHVCVHHSIWHCSFPLSIFCYQFNFSRNLTTDTRCSVLVNLLAIRNPRLFSTLRWPFGELFFPSHQDYSILSTFFSVSLISCRGMKSKELCLPILTEHGSHLASVFPETQLSAKRFAVC